MEEEEGNLMRLESKNNKRLSEIIEKCKKKSMKVKIILYYQNVVRHLLMFF